MFSKHVWYDRKHQAEVFITSDGVVSGTIIAYKGSVCVVNPRPEILSALYQEAKLKRILSLKTIILTDNTIDYARGLCSVLNYSRGLRRHSPLTVIARTDTRISTDFLTSCCSNLLNDADNFRVTIERIQSGESYSLGDGSASFERLKEDDAERNPRLVVRTDQCVIHYLDETHSGASDESTIISADRPNVVIRTAEIPRFSRESRHMLTVLG